MSPAPLVLVTGVTGYVGGRLVPELLAAGYRVRALARHPERLTGHDWRPDVDVVGGDVTDPGVLTRALAGVDVAYHLVTPLDAGAATDAEHLTAARAFGAAAAAAGVGRVVCLARLRPTSAAPAAGAGDVADVADVLLASGVPTAVLRAGVVIGSGSASFEMLRYLTERLPVMVTPRWLTQQVQPVAVRDVLRYLVGAAALPAHVSRSFDIGGPDVLSYREMMQRYAAVAGLPRRVILPLAVRAPRLSAHWVGLVTPVPHGIARPLVEGLVVDAVCAEQDLQRWVPDPPGGRLGFDQAVTLALQRVREATVATRWSSAGTPGSPSDPLPSDPDWAGGSLYADERATPVRASPEHLWAVIQGIGGENGWYSWPLAWSVRGWLDRFSGGPGLTRGRRDPARVHVGDALDWWRVEEVEPMRLLRLRAEMKAPGLAWLELLVEQDPVGRTLFRQRALFHPRGLAGHAYWWAVAPFHAFVFGGMQANVAVAAERLERESQAATSQRTP
ncbi:SDR family oxidoreductase [Aquipuribacter hungaricus]|uniref:SDR family oxidoreductase n=2 Tax=Aquipuribacter hungaricus TaxID=545624 RepID=A0ABV7WDC2_9MICO